MTIVNGINFILVSVFPKLVTFFSPWLFLEQEVSCNMTNNDHLYRDFGSLRKTILPCLRSPMSCWYIIRPISTTNETPWISPSAPWMNDKLCSLYYWNMNKVNFFFLVRCLYTKKNKTWLFGDIAFLFNSILHSLAALTCEIPSWTLKEKFNSSMHPSIMLHLTYNIQYTCINAYGKRRAVSRNPSSVLERLYLEARSALT